MKSTIIQQSQDGYRYARAIDDYFNERLEKLSIESNPYFWLKVCRTVKTTLDLLEQIAHNEINNTREDKTKRTTNTNKQS